MNTQLILGISAGIISFSFYFFYIISILRGETKPEKESWWVFSIIGAAIVLSYFFSGARDTIWIPLGEAIGPFIIAMLSLKYGKVESKRLERFSLFGVLCGTLLWAIFRSPVIALTSFIAIDFLALLPILYKSYREPKTESYVAWMVSFIACFINIFAVETLSFNLLIYPVYTLIVNAAVVFLLTNKPKRHTWKARLHH